MKKLLISIFLFSLFLLSSSYAAENQSSLERLITEATTTPLPSSNSASNTASQNTSQFLPMQYQLKMIGFLAIVTLIPFGVMMLTSFTRISILFNFLRQALGFQQIPSNQIVIGLSLILTGFVMHPVITQIENEAVHPYLDGKFQELPQVKSGQKSPESIMIAAGWKSLRRFLLQHTREKDLLLFLEIGNINLTIPSNPDAEFKQSGDQLPAYLDAIPWYCIVPSFVMSELRIAFMMGFLLFLPFLIIDMVVSSVLMSMGMMMLPPVLISTPFKLLLFILIDGWRLIIHQIVQGF